MDEGLRTDVGCDEVLVDVRSSSREQEALVDGRRREKRRRREAQRTGRPQVLLKEKRESGQSSGRVRVIRSLILKTRKII